MSKVEPNIDNRSGEVQEVLGLPPNWLVRYGTLIIFLLLISLACLAVMLEYPDTVDEKITVYSSDPPRKIFAAKGNYIDRLLVNNEDTVERDQLLAVYRTTGNFVHVMRLEDLLNSIEVVNDTELLSLEIPKGQLFGELESDIFQFLEKQNELQIQYNRNRNPSSSRSLKTRRDQTQNMLTSDLARKASLNEQIDLVNQRLAYNKRLFDRKEISYTIVRQTEEEVIALEREMEGLESTIRSRRYEIENINNQINSLKVVNQEVLQAASNRLQENFYRLQDRIATWKEEHLVFAPINGIVVFGGDDVAPQQYIAAQREVMSILPMVQTETIGRVYVPLKKSGTVEIGQKVIVKLNSFPFLEYGAVFGQVKWKGTVPNNESKILVEVEFPDGLVTNRSKEIDPIRELLGEAQIITKDKRFVERIFSAREEPTVAAVDLE